MAERPGQGSSFMLQGVVVGADEGGVMRDKHSMGSMVPVQPAGYEWGLLHLGPHPGHLLCKMHRVPPLTGSSKHAAWHLSVIADHAGETAACRGARGAAANGRNSWAAVRRP